MGFQVCFHLLIKFIDFRIHPLKLSIIKVRFQSFLMLQGLPYFGKYGHRGAWTKLQLKVAFLYGEVTLLHKCEYWYLPICCKIIVLNVYYANYIGQLTEIALQESSIAGQGSTFQPVHNNLQTVGSVAVQCNLPHSHLHERLKKAVQSTSIPYKSLIYLIECLFRFLQILQFTVCCLWVLVFRHFLSFSVITFLLAHFHLKPWQFVGQFETNPQLAHFARWSCSHCL